MNLYQKLMNKLFGWDYALVSWAFSYEVCRVVVMPSGKRFYKAYGDIYPLEEGHFEPLTWEESDKRGLNND